MIQVEGLTKYYGSYKAIDSLSFHADPGEVVGFLGPNGAGKTTTMRILTGYMPANEGKVTIAGYDIFEQSITARQHIGYLPETVPLYKEMTVWQYVDFMASLRGMRNPGRADRVDEVLEQVGMLDRADSLIDGLSKGMRQRVGLAQALVHKPSVIILDEPTIGLDPRQVQGIRELIRETGQNAAVLLSTHILEEVKAMCSRILVINKGQIVAEDDPATLAKRLQGGAGRFLVRVTGAKPAEVAKAIKTVKGVASTTVEEDAVQVVSKKGEDVRGAVTTFIVATKGWELLESKSLDMSLEDIFLQLTAETGSSEEED